MSKSIAALLSFILPGLGQFYNKENKKGLFFFVIGVVASFNGIASIAIRLVAAYEAYDVAKRIESGEDKPVEEETEEVDAEPEATGGFGPEEKPPVASVPKKDVLLKTLLKITTDDRYYQYDEIRKAMASEYDTPQNWLTNAWVGRKLGPLGFTDKKRVSAGTEVKLTASEILNLARKNGLF